MLGALDVGIEVPDSEAQNTKLKVQSSKSKVLRPSSSAFILYLLLPASCLLLTAFYLFLPPGPQSQTIELAIKGADVNAPVHHSWSRVDVVANLDFRDLLTIVSRKQMNPARLVTKDDTIVDNRRGPPNWAARLEAPYQRALIGRQAVHITITRADIDLLLVKIGLAQMPVASLPRPGWAPSVTYCQTSSPFSCLYARTTPSSAAV